MVSQLPAWYGGFTAAWGISVSFLLHLHTYGHADTIEVIAPYVNGAAITIPTIFTASVVPLCSLATHHFSRLMDYFGELDRFLADGAATYTGRFSILSLAPAMPVLEALEAELRPFLRWFKATFAVYAGFAAFLTLVSIVLKSFGKQRTHQRTPDADPLERRFALPLLAPPRPAASLELERRIECFLQPHPPLPAQDDAADLRQSRHHDRRLLPPRPCVFAYVLAVHVGTESSSRL